MDSPREIQRERLFYIDFLAFFAGQVTRKDLISRFGISEPAATKDLSLYAAAAPDMLRYDVRQKCYVYAGGKPYFTHQVNQALFSLAGERAIALDSEHGKRLESWVTGSMKRKMPLELVAAITRCMFQGRVMQADYVSMSSGQRERKLSPLALVHDGLRWHIRCFDHDRSEFRDQNLARFHAVREGELSKARLEDDKEWTTEACLKLVVHPKATHPETVRTDYDIVDDAKYVTLKSCLVGYFLRQWHIDFSDEATGNPKAHHLYLANKNELIEQGVPRWAFNM
jgi:hypothetical protein